MPFFIPLALIFALPWAFCAHFSNEVRERMLFRCLKAQQCVMAWTEVERQIDAGTGTFIIEQANKLGARFWWTPDDLGAVAPFSLLVNLEAMGMEYVTGKSSNPFIPWCLMNYLSVKTGKAFLTRFDRSKLPHGPVETSFFQDLYPRARIVQTLLIRKRD